MKNYQEEVIANTPAESAMTVKVANQFGAKHDKYQRKLVQHLQEMELARDVMQKAFQAGSMKLVNDDFQLFLKAFCLAMVAIQKSQENRARTLRHSFADEEMMINNEKQTDFDLENKMLRTLASGSTPAKWIHSLGVIAQIGKNNKLFKQFAIANKLNEVTLPSDKRKKLKKLKLRKKIIENKKAIEASQKNGKK